ncbi:hypothetical protein NST17_19605 [Caldifermentibacillus hisashii]|uniref:DNA polymerase III beta sliding clamp C-terminal domain-containing protein n=1 Tax=Caldifermentibacillus hisashii TaxID=996558 RepID=A0ABU9K2L3_9BACI
MTTQTIKKQLTFNQAMTQFKKYVAKSDTRPALKYVQYHENDYLVATNGYVLLRIHTDYITDIPKDYATASLINPKTLEIRNDLKYPEVSRIIPNYRDSNINIVLNDNIKDLQDVLKQLKPIYKHSKNKVVKMELSKDKTILSSKGYDKDIEIYEEHILNNVYSDYDNLTISFNGDYFQNVLTVAKKFNGLTKNNSMLHFYSNVMPFLFTQPGVFDAIVMPVRTF